MELNEEVSGEAIVDVPKKLKKKFVHPKKSTEDRKKEKESRRLRKARVILRNISYKTTPAKLQEEFSKYGPIKECNVLKRADGKLVGCAFIQYEKVNHAAKAIHHANAKEFLGRPVVIDWAVNQKKFSEHLKKNKSGNTVKTEDALDDDDVSIKSEENSDDDEKEASDEDENGASEEEDEDSDEDNKDDLEDSKNGIKPDPDEDEKKPIHRISNDVVEGCTVFIKNVPFAATSDELRKVCRQFGAIYYALINSDKVSGHSKGSGFVKFKAKESADMCLSAGTSFKLLDQVLDPHPALSRNDIRDKQNVAKKTEPADSRNLYLAKEGLIAVGTPAAEGVSQSDMTKRLHIEQSKSQLLKNLNRFISRERLTVHNIPPSYDSVKLRKVIEKACKLKPKECRVMRENKPSMGQPLGKSKGYGFLSFKTHNEALQCLRKVNNNPSVFGKNNRPIVSFSIEDKAVHNIKMKRLQKSRDNNPLFKSKKDRRKERRLNKREKQPDVKPQMINVGVKSKPTKISEKTTAELPEFSGALAEKGSQFKSRPKWQLKEDANTHLKQTSEIKKAKKRNREQAEIRKEKNETDRTKKGKGKQEIDNTLVNKYLRMLHSNDENKGPKPPKRSKWYVE